MRLVSFLFGSLLVMSDSSFESLHLPPKLNKARGIAESVVIFGLDCGSLALKFDKFVLLYCELRLNIFWLRFHIDAPGRELQIDQLSRC